MESVFASITYFTWERVFSVPVKLVSFLFSLASRSCTHTRIGCQDSYIGKLFLMLTWSPKHHCINNRAGGSNHKWMPKYCSWVHSYVRRLVVLWFCQGSAILGQVERIAEGDDTLQYCLNSAFRNNSTVKTTLKRSRARLWHDSSSSVVSTRRYKRWNKKKSSPGSS